MKITVGIPTKNRYDTLSHTLLSIAMQSMKPYEVIIVDDSDNPIDIRTIPVYLYILKMFDDYGIKWTVLFGDKLGQHHSHQKVQNAAEGDLIFRIDDDCVAEPEVLRKLYSVMRREKVGAVAPAVLMPNAGDLPMGMKNTMKGISTHPNAQWFIGHGISSAEHLYSCFLYRKGIVNYDLNLSTVAHREETIFSHSIYREGYHLFVNHDARVWHFREDTGGIRTFQHKPELWAHDEKIFHGYLAKWGVSTDVKYVVLDNGLGDHYAFKNILPEIRKKHKKIVIACCYPEVFHDEEGLDLLSIAQIKLMFGNINMYNVYWFMTDHNWKGTLTDAFKQLYV